MPCPCAFHYKHRVQHNPLAKATPPPLWIFGLTIFSGAFLLFQIQPLIGKYILPWFGGGPGVWTTCLLFFQCMLFAGYAYAHWLSHTFTLSRQVTVHLVLVVLALCMLPITPAESWKPQPGEVAPVQRILMLLLVSVGLPYLVLSSTGPLVQAWFSRAHEGRSPYRLYALSNVGSLLALVSFPFLFEPATTRSQQVVGWSIAGALYLVLYAGLAWRVRNVGQHEGQPVPAAVPTAPAAGAGRWLLWLALPACGTMLLMSATNLICQEIAVIPFLWVLPLGLYLVTFIIAFDSPRWYLRPLFAVGFFVAAGASAWALLQGVDLSIGKQIGIYSATLFTGCMVCHGELFRVRPAMGGLTAYFLCIAGGGALGGIFVSLGAPALFATFYWEFHLALVLCAVLGCGVWLAGAYRFGLGAGIQLTLLLAGLTGALTYGLGKHVKGQQAKPVFASRNFYGLLKVTESTSTYEEGNDDQRRIRYLVHGRITHGTQFEDDDVAQRPVSYFSPDSGIGLALDNVGKPKRVGVLGLGVGSVASYAQRGDVYRFYEINPAVEHVAENVFTYLAGGRARGAKVSVVLGDGRLMLEAEKEPQRFDVLSMDAFSSDSVPVHLLSNEAFKIYEEHLAPTGVIVINITNRYLDLEPVVAKMAVKRDYAIRIVDHNPDGAWLSSTVYVLLTRRSNAGWFDKEEFKGTIAPRKDMPDIPLWTDDYASLFRILR